MFMLSSSTRFIFGACGTVANCFQLVEGVVENLLDYVRAFGFVPNGGRVYYLDRCAQMCWGTVRLNKGLKNLLIGVLNKKMESRLLPKYGVWYENLSRYMLQLGS